MDVEKQSKRKALIFQNAAGEGPGILADVLDHRGWEKRILHLYCGESIPSSWTHYDLLLVMGGPMNVYEEDVYPFLAKETEILAKALKGGPPVIGFCLGAQLMAKACGAKVSKGHKKEIGWHRVRLTDKGLEDPLLKSFPIKFTIFQWHGDTFELPERAVGLVSSEDYPNQAMRIGTMSYGFQFHFEITRNMLSKWIKTGREEIEDMGVEGLPEKIHKDSDSYLYPAHYLAVSFFNSYLDMYC